MAEPPTTEALLSAARAAADADSSQSAARGENLTSMNRLLQWGAANSSGPEAAAAAAERLATRTPEQLSADRAWLDNAFPDMFDEVKYLTSLLTGIPVKPDAPAPADPAKLTADELVDILNGVEEYMADLNFAINIAKLGTLAPVVDLASSHASPDVRAAALWVLSTAMQNVGDVKTQVVAGGGVAPIVAGLRDARHAVRAKAVGASSAMLSHGDAAVRAAFQDAGGLGPLVAVCADENARVRRRAMFMLAHAHTSGLRWVVEAVLADAGVVKGIVGVLEQAESGDAAEVEAVCGGLAAMVACDRRRLMEVAPSLPGVIRMVEGKVTEKETREQLRALSDKTSSSIRTR